MNGNPGLVWPTTVHIFQFHIWSKLNFAVISRDCSVILRVHIKSDESLEYYHAELDAVQVLLLDDQDHSPPSICRENIHKCNSSNIAQVPGVVSGKKFDFFAYLMFP